MGPSGKGPGPDQPAREARHADLTLRWWERAPFGAVETRDRASLTVLIGKELLSPPLSPRVERSAITGAAGSETDQRYPN